MYKAAVATSRCPKSQTLGPRGQLNGGFDSAGVFLPLGSDLPGGDRVAGGEDCPAAAARALGTLPRCPREGPGQLRRLVSGRVGLVDQTAPVVAGRGTEGDDPRDSAVGRR